jgi:suppressor of fused
MHDSSRDEPGTSGWQAIDAALRNLYGNQEPIHKAPILHARLGGEFFLDGVSIYRAPESHGEPPHWHFISYGMTELYDKESKNKDVSGWGFEFTFRLARQDNEVEPPSWAISLLMNLARYVYQTGNKFAPGHHMDLRGPIALDHKTDICAALFVRDPELQDVESPNGKFEFLQIVGATLDERDAAQAWDTQNLLAVMARLHPLLVTDLDRPSILRNPTVAAEIDASTLRDGSSSAALYVEVAEPHLLKDQKLELVFGASSVDAVKALLRGRILHGRRLLVRSSKGQVGFEPGPKVSWKEDQGLFVVELSPSTAEEFVNCLKPQRGLYTAPSARDIVIRIVPSDIKDHEGKVLRTIG